MRLWGGGKPVLPPLFTNTREDTHVTGRLLERPSVYTGKLEAEPLREKEGTA